MGEKDKLLERLDSIQSSFGSYGKGSLEPAKNFSVPDVIETGIPEIDNRLLSIGGLPVGRATEIAGETSAGKSTLALNLCRQAVVRGLAVVIAENEGSFTYEYGEKLGLDPEKYMIFKGSELSGEEYLDSVLGLIESGFDIVVVDSIQGIIASVVSDASFQDYKMNIRLANAKLAADFYRKLKGGWTPKLKTTRSKLVKMVDSNTSLIVINHLKNRISDGSWGGSDRESSGSEDLKFIYSTRLWLQRLGMSKDKDSNGDPKYTRVKITAHKTKLSVPGRSAVMYIDNSTGRFLSSADVILKLSVKKGMIEQPGGGGWITVISDLSDNCKAGERFHGKDTFADFCNNNVEVLSKVMGF